MNLFKTKTTETPVVEVKKEVSVAKPLPLSVRPDKIEKIDEYLSLAESLEIASLDRGAVLQRAVADFLWENDVEMYDYNQMKNYMTSLAEKENTLWHWRPLRDKDIPKDGSGTPDSCWGWNHDSNAHDYYWKTKWECRTYDKIVPFEILKNVKLLNDKFPGKLHFFVTDYKSASPDPFIIACARDMGKIIFGVWDEPGFFKT